MYCLLIWIMNCKYLCMCEFWSWWLYIWIYNFLRLLNWHALYGKQHIWQAHKVWNHEKFGQKLNGSSDSWSCLPLFQVDSNRRTLIRCSTEHIRTKIISFFRLLVKLFIWYTFICNKVLTFHVRFQWQFCCTKIRL